MTGADAHGALEADAEGELDAERTDPKSTDLGALRVTREESRVVLDHQVALLNEIEDRTMWAVRVAGVTLGLVISVAGLGGPTASVRPGGLAVILATMGIGCLLGCVFVGIGTSSISKADFGIDESFRSEVVAGSYAEREWLRDLLAGYDEWSAAMQQTNEQYGGYLLVTQFLLLLGIVLLLLAVVLTVMASYL